jgi:hypothetical protein
MPSNSHKIKDGQKTSATLSEIKFSNAIEDLEGRKAGEPHLAICLSHDLIKVIIKSDSFGSQ